MVLAYATRLVTQPNDDPSSQLEHIAQVVATWAQIADPLTDASRVGRRGAHVTTELLGHRDDDLWAWRLQLVHPDGTDPSIMWAVTVACVRETSIDVRVRLDRTRMDGTVIPARDRPAPPGLLAPLLESTKVTFEDAGRALGTAVWVVEPEAAAEFAHAVTHPDRRLPIFGLTPRDVDPIDGGQLLNEVRGLAHVVLIRSETSWELNRFMPRGLNVYGGAARLWWPGANEGSDRWDHKLWTAEISARRLERSAIDLITEAGITAASRDSRMFRLERNKRDERTKALLQELEDLRTEAATARQRQATSPDTTADLAEVDARIRLVETEASALLTDRDNALDLAVGFELEAIEARDRASLAERERDYLRREVGRLRAGADGGGAADEDATEREFVEALQTEIERRGRVDGSRSRSFILGSVFTVTLELQGDKYRSKVIKACADVVIGSPDLLARRQDHALRLGSGGNDPARVRDRDAAHARRCYVEHGTPAARRLHYWHLPDGSIEFASVNVHDDLIIPD